MLHNESYVGRWRYRASQWRKVPGTNRRVPVRRNDVNAIVRERPHLRIIESDLWHEVQERLERVRLFYTRTKDGQPKGRAVPSRSTPYIFSSLLCCGVCGSKMVISGGSKDAYYRCEGHAKRGNCNNALSVRESIVRTGLLDELRHRLVSNQGLAYARKRLAESLGELTRTRDSELRKHRKQLDRLVAQVNQLVNFVCEGHGTAAVAEKLRGLEREADAERNQVALLEKQTLNTVPLPSPDELLDIVLDLNTRLTADTTRGREELRRIFRDGRITLVPQPGGFYIARSEILPLVLLTPTPSEDDQGGRYTASSCAGAIHPLYHAIKEPFRILLVA